MTSRASHCSTRGSDRLGIPISLHTVFLTPATRITEVESRHCALEYLATKDPCYSVQAVPFCDMRTAHAALEGLPLDEPEQPRFERTRAEATRGGHNLGGKIPSFPSMHFYQRGRKQSTRCSQASVHFTASILTLVTCFAPCSYRPLGNSISAPMLPVSSAHPGRVLDI